MSLVLQIRGEIATGNYKLIFTIEKNVRKTTRKGENNALKWENEMSAFYGE